MPSCARILPVLVTACTLAVSAPASAVAQLPSPRLEHTFDGGGRLSFGKLIAGRFLPGGGTVLLDETNKRLYRFTATGTFRDSLGREGGGPGEFRTPMELAVLPNGELSVFDGGKRGLVRWDASGKILPEVRVTPWVLGLFPLGDHLMIKSHDWRTDSLHFFRSAPGGPFPAQPVARFLPPVDPATKARVTTPISGVLVTPTGRLLAWSADTFYVVTELDLSGKVLRRWTRSGVPVVRWTQQELDRIAGYAASVRTERGQSIQMRKNDFDTRPTLIAHSVGLDGSGHLWTLPMVTGGEGRRADVFTPDGRLLGTLPLQGNPERIWVEGDRLLVTGETADGEPAAWIYRIQASSAKP